MIRQAHTYLVGATSAATLIAIAIAAFVVLVSAQVFTDWPIAALGGEDRAAVSDARSLGDGGDRAGDVGAGGAAIAAGTVAPRREGTGASGGNRQADAAVGEGARSRDVGGGSGGTVGTTGSGESPVAAGGGGSPESAAGGGSGGGASQPASSTPSAQGSGGGGGSGGSGGGGSGGGGGGGSGTTGGSTGGGTSQPSTSGALTETVNGTVATVDENALGGTLGSTGVTGVTEGVVEGVAGPESPVGKVVDETVKAVGGLLGGGR